MRLIGSIIVVYLHENRCKREILLTLEALIFNLGFSSFTSSMYLLTGYLEDTSIMTGLKVGSNYKQDGTSKELWQGPLLAV